MSTLVVRLSMTLGVVLLLSCGRKPATVSRVYDPAQVDGQRAMREVRSLVAISPRDSGSEGARLAAEHIAARLQALGVEPIVDIFVDRTPRGRTTFRNVLGIIPGDGSVLIVLASHYDTKPGIANFTGANDSGSSTGLLLELARVLSNSLPGSPGIMLAFLDGEECLLRYGSHDGLHGSRRLAAQLRDDWTPGATVVIVLDMIGDRDLTVTVPRNSSKELVPYALEAARDENARQAFRLSKADVLDDHVPFLLAGMPAIDLIDFEYGSQPGKNDYWHTSEDSLDKLSAASLETVGRVTVRMVNAIAADKAGLK